jgi:hypothetical protein
MKPMNDTKGTKGLLLRDAGASQNPFMFFFRFMSSCQN